MVKGECLECKKEFYYNPYSSGGKFCSYKCYWDSKRGLAERVKIKCDLCGESFLRLPYKIKEKNYCSRSCSGRVNIGKRVYTIKDSIKMSRIAKEKGYGKWMKGKHNSPKTEFKKGHSKPSGMLGKKASIETRKKQSKAHKGENHWNWQGGINSISDTIRKSIDFRLWREAVFARDNYTCQKTGIKGGRLVAHHINNFAQFPELRFVIDNGITLSKKAHTEFHKIYGTKNNNKEQIED